MIKYVYKNNSIEYISIDAMLKDSNHPQKDMKNAKKLHNSFEENSSGIIDACNKIIGLELKVIFDVEKVRTLFEMNKSDGELSKQIQLYGHLFT